MLQITTKDYAKVLKHDIENFRRVVISGAPGIGKSVILKALQSEEGKKKEMFEDKLSPEWEIIEERIYNRGEFATGIPTITTTEDGSESTTWTIPEWMLKIKDAQKRGKKVCLLLDDFHLLVEELQKPMYEFFERFTLNNFSVDPCAIVILGNYNVEELSMKATIESPIMGRMHAYYQLKPDLKHWMLNVDGIHQKILVYLSQNPENFYTENPENTTMYPSPRTWEKASQTISEGHPLKQNILLAILGEKVGGHIAGLWNELGMSIDEMLTPTNKPLDNAIKAMLLAKEANLEKGKTNFFNILEVMDAKFSEELTMNFLLTTFRKFKKSDKYIDFYQTVVTEATTTLKDEKAKPPKNISLPHYNLLKKYIELLIKCVSNVSGKK